MASPRDNFPAGWGKDLVDESPATHASTDGLVSFADDGDGYATRIDALGHRTDTRVNVKDLIPLSAFLPQEKEKPAPGSLIEQARTSQAMSLYREGERNASAPQPGSLIEQARYGQAMNQYREGERNIEMPSGAILNPVVDEEGRTWWQRADVSMRNAAVDPRFQAYERGRAAAAAPPLGRYSMNPANPVRNPILGAIADANTRAVQAQGGPVNGLIDIGAAHNRALAAQGGPVQGLVKVPAPIVNATDAAIQNWKTVGGLVGPATVNAVDNWGTVGGLVGDANATAVDNWDKVGNAIVGGVTSLLGPEAHAAYNAQYNPNYNAVPQPNISVPLPPPNYNATPQPNYMTGAEPPPTQTAFLTSNAIPTLQSQSPTTIPTRGVLPSPPNPWYPDQPLQETMLPIFQQAEPPITRAMVTQPTEFDREYYTQQELRRNAGVLDSSFGNGYPQWAQNYEGWRNPEFRINILGGE